MKCRTLRSFRWLICLFILSCSVLPLHAAHYVDVLPDFSMLQVGDTVWFSMPNGSTVGTKHGISASSVTATRRVELNTYYAPLTNYYNDDWYKFVVKRIRNGQVEFVSYGRDAHTAASYVYLGYYSSGTNTICAGDGYYTQSTGTQVAFLTAIPLSSGYVALRLTSGTKQMYLTYYPGSGMYWASSYVDQVANGTDVLSTNYAGAFQLQTRCYKYMPGVTTIFNLNGYGAWINGAGSDSAFVDMTGIDAPTVDAVDGYAFVGWNTAADGSGQDITSLLSASGVYWPTTSSTLYAQYVPVEEAKVVEWRDTTLVVELPTEYEYCTTFTTVSTMLRSNVPVGYRSLLSETETQMNLPRHHMDRGVYELNLPLGTTSAYADSTVVFSFYHHQGDALPATVCWFRIPYLISGSASASAVGVAKLTGKQVYVSTNASLLVDEDLTLDEVFVLPGGKLSIKSGKTLTLNHAPHLRAGSRHFSGSSFAYHFVYPQLVANGGLVAPNHQVYYEYLLSNDQFYNFSLPYDVNTNAVVYAMSEEVATIGVKQYNGLVRTTGTTGWEYLLDPRSLPVQMPTLLGGKGYVVYGVTERVQLTGETAPARRTYSYFRFPMTVDLSQGELADADAARHIPVTPYGMTSGSLDPGVNANDAGWNLVGDPYLASYGNGVNGLTTNGVGLLELTSTGYIWRGLARYVVFPSNDGLTFIPKMASKATLPAFKNYFIQIGSGDALSFPLANRVAQVVARTEQPVEEYLTGITLSGCGATDYLGVVIGEDYTSAYDMNADLQHWQNAVLNLSARSGNIDLSFIALSPSLARTAIPLQVSTTLTGSYAFALDTTYDASAFTHLYLMDTQSGKTTDLLSDSYSVSLTKGAYSQRFFLSPVLAPLNPTDLDASQPDAPVVYSDRGQLTVAHVAPGSLVSVVDAAGRLMARSVVTESATFALPVGAYAVTIVTDHQPITLRAIVY